MTVYLCRQFFPFDIEAVSIQHLSYLHYTFYFNVPRCGFIRFIDIHIPIPGRIAIREGFSLPRPSRVPQNLASLSQRARYLYYLSLPTHTRKENRLLAPYTIYFPRNQGEVQVEAGRIGRKIVHSPYFIHACFVNFSYAVSVDGPLSGIWPS